MGTTAILVLLSMVAFSKSDRVTVSTEYGNVVGLSLTLHNGKTVNRFHGIHYGKAPIGDLRFRDPVKPDNYDGDFLADELPDACSQNEVSLIWLTHPLWKKYSEDCLTLNVYTPNDMTAAPYAVMFWLHGGGYVSGGSVQYPGHFLASKDVVVVVVNYRIGAHGFMSTGDDVARGNFGLKDQILALEWVRDNIANFGGDPTRVTVFGQSAGASSAGLLMLSPLAQGLFHQVIGESGSDQAIWGVNEPVQEPEDYTKQVAAQLSCPTNDTEAMMDCLRLVPTEELYSTGFVCKPGYFCQGFAPVVDGSGGVLPDDPWKLRARGEFAKLRMINGQCSDDGSLYTYFLIPESLEGGFNRSDFEEKLRNRLLSLFTGPFPDKEEEIFNALNWYYSDQPWIDDLDRNRESFNQIITDFAFGMTGDMAIKSQSQFADVYHYVLGYRSKNAAAVFPEWTGVPHNGELPYVWAWPWLQLNRNVRFDSGILIDIIDWDEKDIEYSDYIMTLWTNFAKYGNPTPEPVPTPDGGEPAIWPKFDITDYNYIRFYDEVEVATAYRQKRFAFWLDYVWELVGLDPIGSRRQTPPSRKGYTEQAQPKEGIDVKQLQTRMSEVYATLMKKALDRKR